MGGLAAAAICAGLTGCSTTGPDLAVKAPTKPVALPAPGAHTTSASLCTTAFGPPAAIAKEFGATSLKLSASGTEPQHPYSIFQCGYVRPGPDGDGLALTLTTQNFLTIGTSGGGPVFVGKAGAIYAYANTPGGPVPRNIQEWLQKAAARVTSPTICKTTGHTTTSTTTSLRPRPPWMVSLSGMPYTGYGVFAQSTTGSLPSTVLDYESRLPKSKRGHARGYGKRYRLPGDELRDQVRVPSVRIRTYLEHLEPT